MTRSSGQSVADGAAIQFNSTISNPWGMWVSSDNTAITVPLDGLYNITATLSVPVNTTAGARGADIHISGTSRARSVLNLQAAVWNSAGTEQTFSTSTTVAMTKDQFVTLRFATAVTLTLPALSHSPRLSVTYVGPAA